MGKHARIGLLLGASACLLAAMVGWVVEELDQHGNPSAGKLASSLTTCPAAAAHSAAAHRAGGQVTMFGQRGADERSTDGSRQLLADHRPEHRPVTTTGATRPPERDAEASTAPQIKSPGAAPRRAPAIPASGRKPRPQ
jgi:hypothetical protein